MHALPPLSAVLLACAVPAQDPDDVIVATRHENPVRTELWTVNVLTGASAPLPAFPSAQNAPLAITRDPVDRAILLAQAAGPATRVLRLYYDRRAFVRESVVADLPGRASQLLAATHGFVATFDLGSGSTGGRDRHAAAPWSIAPNWMAAACLAEPAATRLRVLRSHPRADQFSTFLVDFVAHAIVPGSEILLPRDGNGIVELGTNPLQLLLSHSDGSFSILQPALSPIPQPVPLSMWITRDGAFALGRQHDGRILALGNGGFPYLYELDFGIVPGQTIVRVLSPILPGFPVDFAPAPGDGAAVLSFASPCGLSPDWRIQALGGLPVVGNRAFALDLPDATGHPLLLWSIALDPLPQSAPLPNGCTTVVVPDILDIGVVFAGHASLPLPIPAQPTMIGATAFVQGLQPSPTPFLTSDAVVVRVGR